MSGADGAGFRARPVVLACAILAVLAAARPPGGAMAAPRALVVNSLGDASLPPPGVVTLRSAVRRVAPGGRITFAPGLAGRTVRLRRVDQEHSVLPGEVFAGGQYLGYLERDYGRSALYARKSLTIDASALPGGITLRWDGGDATPARVLAVYGDLTLRNVTILSGHSRGEPTGDPGQPFTLARGGGIAVWGTATLKGCTLGGNRATGDAEASRDRGAFGGGIYGDVLLLRDTVVSGNAVSGYGAAGGGVYSVGGAEQAYGGSRMVRCAVTGNRVTGQHAYGGGVYSDGGGRGNNRTLRLTNCTVARNSVEDNPAIPEPAGSQYYFRGGGLYMSNGSLDLQSCTIVQNAVTGPEATFNGKPNTGGGGVAATIGNAHVVEYLGVGQSIVVGNSVNGSEGDIYSGSLLDFQSRGFNLVGTLDFSQILVPIPAWDSLSRKHWPRRGDEAGVRASHALALGRVRRHPTIRSAGTDAGERAVLWFPPGFRSRNRVPVRSFSLVHVHAGYSGAAGADGVFLEDVLTKIRADHGDTLGADFGNGFGDLAGITFQAVAGTWPSEPSNAAWISFWRDLDTEIDGRLGPAGLGDAFWRSFPSAPGVYDMSFQVHRTWHALTSRDQLGGRRPAGGNGDIGAIER